MSFLFYAMLHIYLHMYSMLCMYVYITVIQLTGKTYGSIIYLALMTLIYLSRVHHELIECAILIFGAEAIFIRAYFPTCGVRFHVRLRTDDGFLWVVFFVYFITQIHSVGLTFPVEGRPQVESLFFS